MSGTEPIARLIELLHQAMRAQALHAPEHPVARQALAELEGCLPPLLAAYGAIRLLGNGEGLSFQDEPMLESAYAALALSRELELRNLGGIAFLPGLDPGELSTLLFILLTPPERVAEMGGAEALLPEDGLLRVLPRLEPTPVDHATALVVSGEDLAWDEVFVPPAPPPEVLAPIAWVSLAEAGLEECEFVFLPETVPQPMPEPEPLTAEELRRLPPAQH
jgi:hypothetical protein